MSVTNEHFLASVCFSEAHDKATIDEVAQLFADLREIDVLEVAPNKGRNRTHIFCATKAPFLVAVIDRMLNLLPMRLKLTKLDDSVHGLLQSISLFPFRESALPSVATITQSICEKISALHQLPAYLYLDEDASVSPSLSALRELSRDALLDTMSRKGWMPHFGPHIAHQQLGYVYLTAKRLPVNLELHFAGDDIAFWESLLQHESTGPQTPKATLFEEIDVEVDPTIQRVQPVLEQLRTFVDDLPSERKIRIWCRLGNYSATPIETVIGAFREIGMHIGMPYVGGRIIGHLPAEAVLNTTSGTPVKAFSLNDDHYQETIRETVHDLQLDVVDNFVIRRQIVDHIAGGDKNKRDTAEKNGS